MPNIKVLFWNIQNFGTLNNYKGNYHAVCEAIAAAVQIAQADVLFIMELKQMAIANNDLQRIQQYLNNLPAPLNNWYYDWIKGSVDDTDGVAVPPFATAHDLDWDSAHYEGYAMFWNQNIAKFTMQKSPPITPPGGGGPVANTQSEVVRGFGQLAFGGMPVPIWGFAVPGGGITVPGGGYILPAGTTAPVGAAINNAGGGVLVPAGGVLGAATPINPGSTIPQGTTMGANGLQLNAAFAGLNPLVVPGNFLLTDALVLPPVGSMVVPDYSLSLVLIGRDTRGGGLNPSTFTGNISAATADFNPAGVNNWQYLYFTRGAGYPASMKGTRRPTYCTIKVNRPALPAAVDQLVPLLAYHAPAAAPASSSGMQRAAYSQPIYQVYDWGAGNWINNNFAVIGGDFNVRLNIVHYAYEAFLDPFHLGGAQMVARVDNPFAADDNTTAQVTNPPVGGAAIVSANTINYRLLPIDNIFYGILPPATAPLPAPGDVFDLLRAITNAMGVAQIPLARVQNYNLVPVFNQHWNIFAGLAVGPGPATPGFRNISSFVNDLAAGNFVAPAVGFPADPPARRAAEFVHFCLSDHLPVVFQLNM